MFLRLRLSNIKIPALRALRLAYETWFSICIGVMTSHSVIPEPVRSTTLWAARVIEHFIVYYL